LVVIYFEASFHERIVDMDNSSPEKIFTSAYVDLADHEARIEKLSSGEDGQATIRLSACEKGKNQAGPLVLSEQQLIELLHKAIHAGVVSQDFIGKLREKIEI
jgi:hypothetical protein